MHRYFADLRDEGVAVVIVSEDLGELLSLSDRVGVLCGGRLMAVVDSATADIEQIGLLMGGRTSPDLAPVEALS